MDASTQIPESGAHPTLYIKKSLSPLAAGESVNGNYHTHCVCPVLGGSKYRGSCRDGAGAEDEAKLSLSFCTGLGLLSGWTKLRRLSDGCMLGGASGHRANACT